MAGFLERIGVPDQAEVDRLRRAKGLQKGPSRLDVKQEREKQDGGGLDRQRKDVWKRDKGICRVCQQKVERTLALTPLRGEVHHLKGRADKAVRHDRRNGLLVCHVDHERLEKNQLFIVATAKQMFIAQANGKSYINADGPIRFKERT